jgi:hypothetical protein
MRPAAIEELLRNIGDGVDETLGHRFTILDSAFWYKKRFDTCGDWQSWIWDAVTGKDYHTRQPHFSGFIVCTPRLGRANAEIARLALTNRMSVLYWSPSSGLSLVKSVTTINEDSWVDGWGVETQEIGA